MESNITLDKEAIIVKQDNVLKTVHKVNKSTDEYIADVGVRQGNDMYEVNLKNEKEESLSVEKLEERPWLIIRYTYNHQEYENGYKLREGDYLKFGKIIFKVKEIKLQNEESYNYIYSHAAHRLRENLTSNNINQNIDSVNNINNDEYRVENTYDNNRTLLLLNNNNNNNNISMMNIPASVDNLNDLQQAPKRRKNSPVCRICLCEDYDKDNPLINPCMCSGTMKYIHLACLKMCLKSKIQTKVFNFLIAHFYKTFECELCKKVLPEKIKVKDQVFNLLELQKPDNNYIVLESISKERMENKFIYIIHMKDRNRVKIGRASEADVRITDISVSRNHAELKLINRSFYISDNTSKFGTLVQVCNKLIVMPNRPLAVQLRKHYLSFRLTRKPTEPLYANYNDYFQSNDLDEDNVTEIVSKYDSNLDQEFDNVPTVSNLNLNMNNTNRSHEVKENAELGNNLVNSNVSNNIVKNNSSLKSKSSQNAVPMPIRPSIQLNININVTDGINGMTANIKPRIDSSPQNIQFDMGMTEVKHFVDNIINLQGLNNGSNLSLQNGFINHSQRQVQSENKENGQNGQNEI